MIISISEMPCKLPAYSRYCQAPARLPGNNATVLEALAVTGKIPVESNTGKLTKEPPPAIAFIAPANKPEANNSILTSIVFAELMISIKANPFKHTACF